jgi:hypothetical protein
MRAGLLAPENRKWLTLAAVTFGLFKLAHFRRVDLVGEGIDGFELADG